ncbi:MAG: RNA polymerase sigma factor RpoE [bacterium]|nr:MAG: RNA polymerase sigma factor RpoE [bacterium]
MNIKKRIENQLDQFELECLVHCDSLYNLARYLTLDENEADDLLQDTLLRGYQFFHQFESHTNCKAWLYKIMKNLFINHYRKKKRRPNTVSIDNEYDGEIERAISTELDQYTNPEHYVLNEMLSSEVICALNLLPEDYKMAVIMADLEYLSYNEMADLLDCPIGTVRSRLSRGRKMLKKMLFNFALKEGVITSKHTSTEKAMY